MLIEEIDGIDLQALERGFRNLMDAFRPAVETLPTRTSVGIKIETKLGGDHHLPAEGGEGLAQEFFIRERAVDLGRVEKGDAALDGRTENCDHLLLVLGRAVRKAHAHASEP